MEELILIDPSELATLAAVREFVHGERYQALETALYDVLEATAQSRARQMLAARASTAAYFALQDLQTIAKAGAGEDAPELTLAKGYTAEDRVEWISDLCAVRAANLEREGGTDPLFDFLEELQEKARTERRTPRRPRRASASIAGTDAAAPTLGDA